jgi:hypothetical protein
MIVLVNVSINFKKLTRDKIMPSNEINFDVIMPCHTLQIMFYYIKNVISSIYLSRNKK